jgi:hypothetical protein
MATETSQISITRTGIEASQIFLTPIFFDEDITAVAQIDGTMVQNEKTMAFFGEMGDVLQNYEKCGFTPKGDAAFYDRCIRVEDCKVDLQFCIDGIKGTIYNDLLKRGTDIQNIDGTVFQTLLLTRAMQALKKHLKKVFWFGSRGSANPSITFFNGVWGKWIPQLVADSLLVPINLNSGTPLSPGQGLSYIEAVWTNASIPLKGIAPANKRIYVSGTIYEQYMSDIESLGTNGGGFYQVVLNGMTSMAYRGIPVIPFYEWDEFFIASGLADQHRIMMTTPDNLLFGTDMISDTTSFRMWFDEQDEVFKLKTRFKAGTSYIHEKLFSVGY